MPDQVVVGFISLGCAKNLVDSEVMLARLAEADCAISADLAEADVIVVNTCGFLAAARQEALEAIDQAVQYKRSGRCRRVVVVGCLVQRDRDRLRRSAPDVDVLLGVNQRERLAHAVLDLDRFGEYVIEESACGPVPADAARLRLTPRNYAYLRISEGCEQRCTFCTIPMIRGPMRSKPVEVVLDEARELIADGVVELNVIAQDTTAYGHDLGDGPRLPDLLRELNALQGVAWIRLMYAYPHRFDGPLIDALADGDRIVKYVDLPLQHINDRVLRRMGRRGARRDIERLLHNLRDRMPHVALRTTLMVGFPSESDAEFEELLSFVHDARFDALGVFAYSNEPETPAARLSDQLAESVKQERLDALMQAQQTIAFAKADAMVGRKMNLLTETFDVDGALIARHAGQAPEVDGIVTVLDAPENPGAFIEAECVARKGYDLIARPTGGILNPET